MAAGVELISERIRSRKQAISDTWAVAVRDRIPALRRLDAHALCDHLPEFLEALALWVEGKKEAARPGFEALADGHAVQRLGYGIGLEALTREYALLRNVLIRDCLQFGIENQAHDALVRLDEGIDEAVLGAVRRYARQRDSVRDRFIGILAHDLRNPLNAIAIAAGRLVMTEPSDVAHKTGALILRSANRMTRMIKDVLEFAREHLGGGIPISLSATNLGELAREAVDELSAANPRRDLRIELSGNLDGFWDPDRVLQALSNVIANALQHGTDPIRVAIRETADRQHVETVVSNGGTAPSREQIATMFDPFRTGDAQHGGVGLGLYIVRAIARAHGAITEVRTDTDGAAFLLYIRWPRTPLEDTPGRGELPAEA